MSDDPKILDLELELSFLHTKVLEAKKEQADVKPAPLPEPPKKTEIELQVAEELAAIESEYNRRRFCNNPTAWVSETLGEYLWTKQQEIMQAIVEHRRVAVPSCFNSGKSFTAARLVAWWIDVHPPGEAFVVTTATTGAQVKAILWRELHRAHAKGNLTGRLNQTEWWIPSPNGGADAEEMVAFGRKPADMDATAFQGIHARWVLVILDEAAGIPEPLFEAADGLITNDESRILAIGNPEDAGSHFASVCKPGSGWKVIRIPAWATPNFTKEAVPIKLERSLINTTWVEEKRKSWGVNNPMWMAKIEANFPSAQEQALIPIAWVEAAQARTLTPGLENELGLDVGAGGDQSVTAHRRGDVVRIIRRDNNPDTMETCGNLLHDISTTRATSAKVDMIGIGRGVVDRAIEQGIDAVVGINVSQAPMKMETIAAKRLRRRKNIPEDIGFVNLRAEACWKVRERFEKGLIDIDPKDDALAAQLVDIRYKRTSTGKIKIESKDEMKKRGSPSPNEFDALVLACLEPPLRKQFRGATWGR